MCCRYLVDLSPELRPFIEAARGSKLAYKMVHDLGRPVVEQGEVKPTDIAPVIATGAHGGQASFPMIWGFNQSDRDTTKRSHPLINARSETAAVKPTFRECWQRRRCIIPAACYFEWEHLKGPGGTKKTGKKYAIQPAGETVTWMAGLYRMEEGFPHFTILTREPSAELSVIHDRMPLILPREAVSTWIDPNTAPETVSRIAQEACIDMIFERA